MIFDMESPILDCLVRFEVSGESTFSLGRSPNAKSTKGSAAAVAVAASCRTAACEAAAAAAVAAAAIVDAGCAMVCCWSPCQLLGGCAA